MINRYKYKDTVWVDITNPTDDEVSVVVEEFDINHSVKKELVSPSVKSRVEIYKDYIYLILHFPSFKHSHSEESNRQEIDFVIGKDFLITTRYETIDAVDKFSKIVEVNTILDRGFKENCTGILFFGVLQEIYQSLFNEMEYIEGTLMKIEENIFAGKEKEMVLALSEASRTLLNFKKATDFHKEVLESLDRYGKEIFDDHFSYHTRSILDEYLKVNSAIKNNMEFVAELRETNNSLLSSKQNEIMKILTIITFIVSPLALIASLFQIDTASRPLIGSPNDFWIIVGAMVVISISMYILFKFKKWL